MQSTNGIRIYRGVRNHPRAAVSKPVQIESGARPRARDERILQLGQGGMFVETKNPEPVGSEISFCFFGTEQVRIEGKGEVVYAMLTGNHARGIGVKFTSMPEHSVTALSELMHKEFFG